MKLFNKETPAKKEKTEVQNGEVLSEELSELITSVVQKELGEVKEYVDIIRIETSEALKAINTKFEELEGKQLTSVTKFSMESRISAVEQNLLRLNTIISDLVNEFNGLVHDYSTFKPMVMIKKKYRASTAEVVEPDLIEEPTGTEDETEGLLA